MVKENAGQRGLYLEVGLSKINPCNTAETPEVRRRGEGVFTLGFKRKVQACRSIDCTE